MRRVSTNMSAPCGSGGSSDELDPESEDFDSLQALYSEKAVPPCPNVRVYDNVEQYENYIKAAQKGTLRQRIQHRQAGRGKRSAAAQDDPAATADPPAAATAGPSTAAPAMSGAPGAAGPSGEAAGERFIIPGRRFTERQAPVLRQRKKQRSVLTRMEAAARPGPLGRIKWCMDQRAKVKVYIRNYGRIRGVCIGYIVAFDKHWNLCLEDVDEIYQKKVRRKGAFLGDPDSVPVVEDCRLPDAEGTTGGQWSGQQEGHWPKECRWPAQWQDIRLDEDECREARPGRSADPRRRTSAARGGRSWSPDRPCERRSDRSSAEDRPLDSRSGRSGGAGGGSGRDSARASSGASGGLSRRAAAEEDPEVARLTARLALLEPPRSRRSQRRPVFETARRHVRQLFVRGDNVVLVAVEGGGDRSGDIQEVPDDDVREVPDDDVQVVSVKRDDEIQEVKVTQG